MLNLLPFERPIRIYWIRHADKLFKTKGPADLGRFPRVTLNPDASNYLLRTLLGADQYDAFVEVGGPIEQHDAMRLFREWCKHHRLPDPETFRDDPPPTTLEPPRRYRRGRPLVQ